MSAVEQFYEPRHETPIFKESEYPPHTHVAKGLGVIAVDDGSKRGTYKAAPSISNESHTWQSPVNPELERYLSYGHNWPGAVIMRQKWEQQTLAVLADFPHLGLE